MATVARLIGGAGTGKTTELMRIMEGVIERGGIGADEIGFVSFTRAARAEASTRAAGLFGCKVSHLEQDGWFRTLHSVCYRSLGVGGELLSGNKESTEWLRQTLGTDGVVADGSLDEADAPVEALKEKTEEQVSLSIWGRARARLEPLEASWQAVEDTGFKCPGLDTVRMVVEKYEQAKRLDDRLDFADLAARFAGLRLTVDGPEEVFPDGHVPPLPVWFFDEQQDTSALLDRVCHRLIGDPRCHWVYVVGDPFQAIYGWAGADHRLFRAWPAAKERILPKSYRCPAEILETAEGCLVDCSDYFDRGIQPNGKTGEVARAWFNDAIFDDIDPRAPWLLLARTNQLATKLAGGLNRHGIPWLPTKGNGGWKRPAHNQALDALLAIEKGHAISSDEWRRILDVVPSKLSPKQGGHELVTRGAKTLWKSEEFRPPGVGTCMPSDLGEWGATPAFVSIVTSGKWRGLVAHAEEYANAVARWGAEAVANPKVRVGTIHSAKGAEADNVLLLTTSTYLVERSAGTTEGRDEEQRVAYVACSRARNRLIIASERTGGYRMRIPA